MADQDALLVAQVPHQRGHVARDLVLAVLRAVLLRHHRKPAQSCTDAVQQAIATKIIMWVWICAPLL